MGSVNLRFRQVHLDFHTSAACGDVGADFDPQVFAETVKMGRVNSMTIFAKCHHGFSYIPLNGLSNSNRGWKEQSLPPPLLVPVGPGWAEFTLHSQLYGDGQTTRKIVHIVTYHPRRTLQPVPHVDQSWMTSGLSMKVLSEGKMPEHVYLAPDRQTLDFVREGDYVRIDLPPVGPQPWSCWSSTGRRVPYALKHFCMNAVFAFFVLACSFRSRF